MVLLTSVEDGRRCYLKEAVGSFVTHLPNMGKECHTGQLGVPFFLQDQMRNPGRKVT